MSLIKMIADYDRDREAYIDHLEEENVALKAKISEMISQGMRDAHANQEALLKGILSGAIGKPGRLE